VFVCFFEHHNSGLLKKIAVLNAKSSVLCVLLFCKTQIYAIALRMCKSCILTSLLRMKEWAPKVWEETFLWFKQSQTTSSRNWFTKNVLCEQKKI